MFGQHNINTNLQVCAGNNTGLFRRDGVYFRYYETKFDDFRINARRLFGRARAAGTVHCDYDSGLFYHFSRTYPHYCWTGCLGWIYNELWGYWSGHGRPGFSARPVGCPPLREIALFFEDYACDRGRTAGDLLPLVSRPKIRPRTLRPRMDLRGEHQLGDGHHDLRGRCSTNLCEACRTLGHRGGEPAALAGTARFSAAAPAGRRGRGSRSGPGPPL